MSMGLWDSHSRYEPTSRRSLERLTKDGNSPVGESWRLLESIPSTTGHEKPRGNQGGPPPKAKYSLATDREEYREGKVKSTPGGE